MEETRPSIQLPESVIAAHPPESFHPGPLLKKLLACNPFYLVSAASLLCGFYMVSNDANFPGRENAQFIFNFTALQGYELLLAGTALLLARRRIWYDGTLLVGLENLLLLVPFVLISQAAWISPAMLWTSCAVAGILAVGRLAGLKKWFTELNLPPRLVFTGILILAVNVVLPIAFHHFNLAKLGTKPTDGAAYEFNRLSWVVILPALISLALALPQPRASGELLPQRRWLPSGLFALWLAASVVHLCFLGYVYNFDREWLFVVPAMWALAWVGQRRLEDLLPAWAPPLDRLLLVPPALLALLPLAGGATVMFQILTGLNLAIYTSHVAYDHRNRIALNLFILSFTILGASLVKYLPTAMAGDISAGKWLGAFLCAYACFWIWRSRNPKLGLLGAFIVGIGVAAAFNESDLGGHVALQAGWLFFLFHSLVWHDPADGSMNLARRIGCVTWFVCSAFASFSNAAPQAGWVPGIAAGCVLLVCVLIRFWRGQWLQPSLSVAAASVLLVRPGAWAAERLQSVPTGLWVVAGSFLLFACGTLAALTRAHWQHRPVPVPANPQPNNPPNP